MGFLIVILVLSVIACGILMQSTNSTVKAIGIVLGVIGVIFCAYAGYKLGGFVGAIVGILIMCTIMGKGIQEQNKIDAAEYLANKNKEVKGK